VTRHVSVRESVGIADVHLVGQRLGAGVADTYLIGEAAPDRLSRLEPVVYRT
jgi:hypothetical protein